MSGMIRDVLSEEVPQVPYRAGDFYAAAAGSGAAVTWAVAQFVPQPVIAVAAGGLTTVAVRLGSRVAGITLPVPRDRSMDI